LAQASASSHDGSAAWVAPAAVLRSNRLSVLARAVARLDARIEGINNANRVCSCFAYTTLLKISVHESSFFASEGRFVGFHMLPAAEKGRGKRL